MDNIRDILLSTEPAGIGHEVSAERLNENLLECFPKANTLRYTPDMAEIFMTLGQPNLDITYGFRDIEVKMYAIIFGKVVNKEDWLPFATDVNHVISASNETLLHDILIKDTNKRCRIYEYYQTSIPKGCTSCTSVCNDVPRTYCTRKGFERECEYLLDLWRRQALTTRSTSTTSTGTTSSKTNEDNGSSGGSDSESNTVIISVIIVLAIVAFIAAFVKIVKTVRRWNKQVHLQDRKQNGSASSIDFSEETVPLNETDEGNTLSNNTTRNGTETPVSQNSPNSSVSTCINIPADDGLLRDKDGNIAVRLDDVHKVAAMEASERVENVNPVDNSEPAGTQATD